MIIDSNGNIVMGIGIRESDFESKIEKDALLALLECQYGKVNSEVWAKMGSVEEILNNLVATMCVDSVAELFYLGDESDLLTYSSIHDEGFLYYEPSMPWQITGKSPQSIEDVHRLIINAVHVLCPNMTDGEIETLICDDLWLVEEG